MQQGMQQGALETAQKDVLEILEIRFGTLSYALTEKVKYCEDLHKLKDALRQAALAKSLHEFKF